MAETLNFSVSLGRTFFRWRGGIPIIIFLILFFLPKEFQHTATSFLPTTLGIFLLEGVRIWAVSAMRGANRTYSDRTGRLVDSGPFALVRNPLYLANIGLYWLWAIMFGFTYMSLVVLGFFSIYYSLIVHYEESIWLKQGNLDYRNYLERVPRWIPNNPLKTPNWIGTINFRDAIRSEFYTLRNWLVLLVMSLARIA